MTMVQKAARWVAAATLVTGGGIAGGMLVNSNTPSAPTQTQHVNLSGVEVSNSPSPTDTASDIAGSSASPAPPIYPSDSPSVVPIPLASTDTPTPTQVTQPAASPTKPDDGTLPTDIPIASNPPGGGVPSIAPAPNPNPTSAAPSPTESK